MTGSVRSIVHCLSSALFQLIATQFSNALSSLPTRHQLMSLVNGECMHTLSSSPVTGSGSGRQRTNMRNVADSEKKAFDVSHDAVKGLI
jgi:hypothetical protein